MSGSKQRKIGIDVQYAGAVLQVRSRADERVAGLADFARDRTKWL